MVNVLPTACTALVLVVVQPAIPLISSLQAISVPHPAVTDIMEIQQPKSVRHALTIVLLVTTQTHVSLVLITECLILQLLNVLQNQDITRHLQDQYPSVTLHV